MKRIFSVALLSFVFGLALVPVSIQVTTNRISATPLIATAVTAGCVELSVGINSAEEKEVCPDKSGGGVIITYLKLILKFLSGAVGLVILLMLTIAGVQYTTAAGQPEQVRAAKQRIQNAITALVLFLIAFAVLNMIIPGSIFS